MRLLLHRMSWPCRCGRDRLRLRHRQQGRDEQGAAVRVRRRRCIERRRRFARPKRSRGSSTALGHGHQVSFPGIWVAFLQELQQLVVRTAQQRKQAASACSARRQSRSGGTAATPQRRVRPSSAPSHRRRRLLTTQTVIPSPRPSPPSTRPSTASSKRSPPEVPRSVRDMVRGSGKRVSSSLGSREQRLVAAESDLRKAQGEHDAFAAARNYKPAWEVPRLPAGAFIDGSVPSLQNTKLGSGKNG